VEWFHVLAALLEEAAKAGVHVAMGGEVLFTPPCCFGMERH
jgi:hypothetical protein